MPYTIKLSNGLPLVDIPDGSVDTATTSLNIVGKNLSGYGPYQNENFVHLLENFASTTPPDSPILGQVWYDTAKKQLRVYSVFGSTYIWKEIGNVVIAATKPTLTNAMLGDLWYNSTAKQLNVYNGTDFEIVGTSVPGFGKSRLEGSVILGIKDGESVETQNPVLTLFVDNSIIAIISKFEFAPSSTIPDLHPNSSSPERIFPGINLVGPTLVNGRSDEAHKIIDPVDGSLGTDSFLRTDKTGSQSVISSLAVTGNVSSAGFNGNVVGNVTGNTTGIHTGAVTGNVTGNITGTVTGDVTGNLTGNVTGDVNGNTFGDHTGTNAKIDFVKTKNGVKTAIDLTKTIPEFTGKFIGDLVGNVIADVTGAVTGNVTGDVTGNLIGDVVGNTTGVHGGNVLAADNSVAFNASTKQFSGNLLGNASTASSLSIARTINNVSFDGSTNIIVYDATKLPLTGGVISGNLTLTQQPSTSLHATNKLYVDDYVQSYVQSYVQARTLFFSLDTRGLNLSSSGAGSVVNILNSLAPPSNFTVNTLCRVSSTIQNISTSAIVGRGSWISISFVNSVSVTTTVSDPTRNNNLLYKVNSSKTSWEYVSG